MVGNNFGKALLLKLEQWACAARELELALIDLAGVRSLSEKRFKDLTLMISQKASRTGM
jgi:hypothetical protein